MRLFLGVLLSYFVLFPQSSTCAVSLNEEQKKAIAVFLKGAHQIFEPSEAIFPDSYVQVGHRENYNFALVRYFSKPYGPPEFPEYSFVIITYTDRQRLKNPCSEHTKSESINLDVMGSTIVCRDRKTNRISYLYPQSTWNDVQIAFNTRADYTKAAVDSLKVKYLPKISQVQPSYADFYSFPILQSKSKDYTLQESWLEWRRNDSSPNLFFRYSRTLPITDPRNVESLRIVHYAETVPLTPCRTTSSDASFTHPDFGFYKLCDNSEWPYRKGTLTKYGPLSRLFIAVPQPNSKFQRIEFAHESLEELKRLQSTIHQK